jgi:hypothetical protein
MRNNWKPKKGDTVFVHSGDTRHSSRTGIVKSSGTKWIVLEHNEFRFNAETKRSEYCDYTLYPSEEAYVEELKRSGALNKLRRRLDSWRIGGYITFEQIQRINDVLDEVEKSIEDEKR